MENVCEPFKDKRITIMGLGLLGRGVGDAEFLATCGAQVVVTDKKSEEELKESVEKLKKYSNITFHLGGHSEADFVNADLVIKAAGVPLDSPEIAAAREANVPVTMSTALFAKYAAETGAKIVGITGTRGKSTVTQMIYHTLKHAGKSALLGGNIRGLSTLALLHEVKPSDICVLELDSWQLQGFGDLNISPSVSVFTNLMPDHQNYYANMDEYFTDKANIFRYQKPGDTLVVAEELMYRVRAEHPIGTIIVPELAAPDWQLRIPGEHNRMNAGFAIAALHVLGLTEEEIRAGMETFEGVEGRLQFVREVKGVKIYNDNNATTPEATIAALRALEGPIVLIVGGSEKGLELADLVSEIKSRVSRVIVLVHSNYAGSERLKSDLSTAGIAFSESNSLEGAVEMAMKDSTSAALLFSPAFASFGMFKNEYERNDKFLAIVQKIK